MDYRYKDIYTFLLPGFLFMVELVYFTKPTFIKEITDSAINACCIYIYLLLGNLLLTMLMTYAYHRQRRRYYQVFLAEFCKQYNEKTPNKTIPLESLY